ncbi:MAG: RidA family protein [Alphaproteobacteria bacterium]|nr:RidA family protein [Alphaproteobacteria bacterium]
MTNIRRVEPGARMSEAVIYGDRIYTAGIVADAMIGKSVFEQTQEILQQIDALLAQAGSDKTRILKANIWLSDISTFAQMNQAWDGWVVAGQAPARATVEAKLAAPGYHVEIMIEAIV